MQKYSYIAYIEGDTSGIISAMKDVEERGKDLNRRMKVINEGLKFNPESVELLGSKFDNLSEQLDNAKTKFEALKSVEEQAKHSRETGNMSKDNYAYYQQQLAKAENSYKTLEIAVGTAKAQLDRAKEAMEQNAYATKGLAAVLTEVETAGKSFDAELKEIDTSLRNGGGAEILGQKYDILSQAVENTEKKLEALKSAQKNMAAGAENGTVSIELQREYQRAVDSTSNKLVRYKQELEQVSQKIEDTGDSADEAEKDTRQLGDAIDDAGKRVITLGDIIKANLLSDLISRGIDFLKDKITDFAKQGIKLASDLQEVQNVVDVTFGDGANQIYEWADAAAESFGMSSLSAQKFTGTIGAMLKSQGIANDSIADMSMTLAGLAGDMASFYNIDVEQAFEKIRSGISGETEPLKQLGINMNVANLEAYALSQGIEKTWNSMSVAEQTMLRYNYLLSQTADAQGDFARTSDSFANQQRILQLNIENLSASFGEKLLPSLNKTFDTANEKLPKLENSVENIGEILGNVTSFAIEHHEAILGLVSAYLTYQGAMKIGGGVSTLVGAFKSLTTATQAATTAQQGMNAAAAANPYVIVAAAIAAVTVGLVSLVSAAGDASKSLKEIAEESIEEYENQKEKVSELETELKSVRDRITEIQSKGKLNFTDTEELTNLQLQNQELSTRLEIEKELLETKKQMAGEDTAYSIMADDFQSEGTIASIEYAIDRYEEAKNLLVNAEEQLANGEIEDNETYRNSVENFKAEMQTQKLSILENTTAMNELADKLDLTTESGKNAQAAVDGVNDRVMKMFDIAEEEPTLGINTEVHGENAYARDQRLAYENAQNEKKIRDENLKDYVANLDERLSLRRISEEQYYSELKDYLDKNVNTESKAWYEQLGRYEDYEQKKLDTAKKEAEEEQKTAEENARKQKELSEKEIEDRISAVKEKQELNDEFTEKMMYDEMEIIISGLDKESELYKKYNSEILKGRKKLNDELLDEDKKKRDEELKKISDHYDDIQDKLEDRYDDLKKEKEKVKGEFLDIYLSETVKDKDGNDVDILTDLDEKSKQIDKYESSLARLEKTGISDSLLEKIKGMNFKDGSRQRFIDTLLGLSPDKLKLYYSDWDRYNSKAEAAADNEISDEAEALNEKASSSVRDIFGNLINQSYEDGVETGKKFLQGVYDAMDEVVDPATVAMILSGNYNMTGSSAGNPESNPAREQKTVSWDTPLTFVFDGGNKKYETTIGDIIDEGRRTGGNTLNL